MDNYEKKYNEALERARKIHNEIVNNEVIGFPGQITDIFPELRESEDEGITNTIFNCLYQCCDTGFISVAKRDNALAWLEKQKENPKSANSISADCTSLAKCEDRRQKVGNLYPEEYPATPDECIKPVEWSEEDEHRRKDAIYFLESAMKHYADTSEIEKTIAWLKSLRPAQDCSVDCPKHLEGYISGRADAENKLLEMYGILLMPDGELRMKPNGSPARSRWRHYDEPLINGK